MTFIYFPLLIHMLAYCRLSISNPPNLLLNKKRSFLVFQAYSQAYIRDTSILTLHCICFPLCLSYIQTEFEKHPQKKYPWISVDKFCSLKIQSFRLYIWKKPQHMYMTPESLSNTWHFTVQ